MSKDNHHNLHEGEGFFGLKPNVGPLKQRFVMPPYSILNTRDGDWQNRKRLWLRKGIKSEQGRDVELFNLPLTLSDGSPAGRMESKTSIFDPTLCEIAYSWWCPPGGKVGDPFAGGSVRGVVASVLGLDYYGIELREEQVAANRAQINEATSGATPPKWRQGDSLKLAKKFPKLDFLFSCPPYGNLEVYSKQADDLSNMTHAEFLVGYRQVIKDSLARLKNNRFACFVVANYRSRDKDGKQMHNFVGETIDAFEACGAMFYNDIILVNSVGTGAMRANGTFCRGARKVVKNHQNVLVFVKGDPVEAAKHIPVDDEPTPSKKQKPNQNQEDE